MTDGDLIKWESLDGETRHGYIEESGGIQWAVFRNGKVRAGLVPLEPMTWQEIRDHADEIAETRRIWSARIEAIAGIGEGNGTKANEMARKRAELTR